jgi:hypothetical protein
MPNNYNLSESENTIKSSSLLICSIILGILYDVLFFKKSLGISYFLFVIIGYLVFLWLLRSKIECKLTFGWFLTLPILALSSTYFLFSNRIFLSINFLLVPILIIAQTLLITNQNRYPWFDIRFLDDIVNGIFTRTFSHFVQFFTTILGVLNVIKDDSKRNTAKKILIGLAISIPLLLIIVPLLTSADMVFNNYLEKIFDSLKKINSDNFLQLFLILIVSVLSFSYLWSFLKYKKIVLPESLEIKMESSLKVDSTISITVLCLVNFVYLLFILVQFAYMFGSVKNGLPGNISYADYARKGFFELLTVSLINLSILLFGITFQAKNSNLVKKTISILHSLLVVFTIIILVSAFRRMSLYENAFGFTYLRVLTHSFMILLFILLLVTLYKIWLERISLMKAYIIISLIAYMVINFANIDGWIASRNILRFQATGDLDFEYLTTLSYDNIEPLINLFNKKDVSLDLSPYTDFSQYIDATYKELSYDIDWQSFNWSIYKAKKALLHYKNR